MGDTVDRGDQNRQLESTYSNNVELEVEFWSNSIVRALVESLYSRVVEFWSNYIVRALVGSLQPRVVEFWSNYIVRALF